MKRINTLAELRVEQKALRLKKAQLESEIKKDYQDIKSDLEPLRLLAKGAKGLLSSNGNHNSILGTSAGLAADYITKNALLKNAGFLARFIIPFLAKNAATNIVETNKSKVADWIEGFISKFTNKKTADENA